MLKALNQNCITKACRHYPIKTFGLSRRNISADCLAENKNTLPCLSPNTELTRLLYWYTMDITVAPTDFLRIGPDMINFKVSRARHPNNLTRLMGYFLEFQNSEQALSYYNSALNHEICGFALNFQFAGLESFGFKSPILENSKLPRRAHVIVIGFPNSMHLKDIEENYLKGYKLAGSTTQRTNLINIGDSFAKKSNGSNETNMPSLQRLPKENYIFGEDVVLIRFKDEKEARMFTKDNMNNSKGLLCEVVD